MFFLCYLEKGDVTPHRMDEKFLLRFLRARHFKLNPTYKLVSCTYKTQELIEQCKYS